jgi:hypothetical protein
MATAKTIAIKKPMIQIDDEVREMNDEEYADYLQVIENSPKAPE